VIGAGVGAGVAGAGVGAVVMAPSPESFLPFPWPPAPPFLIAALLFCPAALSSAILPLDPKIESLVLSPSFARRDTRCELKSPRIVLPRASLPSIRNNKLSAETLIIRFRDKE